MTWLEAVAKVVPGMLKAGPKTTAQIESEVRAAHPKAVEDGLEVHALIGRLKELGDWLRRHKAASVEPEAVEAGEAEAVEPESVEAVEPEASQQLLTGVAWEGETYRRFHSVRGGWVLAGDATYDDLLVHLKRLRRNQEHCLEQLERFRRFMAEIKPRFDFGARTVGEAWAAAATGTDR